MTIEQMLGSMQKAANKNTTIKSTKRKSKKL